MIQTEPKLVTFDEFIDWYPEHSESHYELHDGVIVEMPKPTGEHSDIGGFLISELNFEIRQQRRPYSIPRECIIKPDLSESGYEPDVVILDRPVLASEPRWAKESVITIGASIKLVIEIVSTNWRDDYLKKLADYEAMGIAEYWIVDYLGLGGKRYIGSPKQPTLSVCELIEGEYQINQFRGNDLIQSPAFSQLELSVASVFQAPLSPIN